MIEVENWKVEDISKTVVLFRIHDPKINGTLYLKLEEGEATFLVEIEPEIKGASS